MKKHKTPFPEKKGSGVFSLNLLVLTAKGTGKHPLPCQSCNKRVFGVFYGTIVYETKAIANKNEGEKNMSITAQQTQKILQGIYKFETFGFSMLVARLKSVYQREQTQSTLQSCTSEINSFLAKYSMIMGSDFAILSKI